MMGEVRLLYTSHATEFMKENELLKILEQAQKNNFKVGVTGVLLYRSGKFVQLLEGEDSAVSELYNSIKKDRRHQNVELVLKENANDRIFSGWSMAYADDSVLEESWFVKVSELCNSVKSKPKNTSKLLWKSLTDLAIEYHKSHKAQA